MAKKRKSPPPPGYMTSGDASKMLGISLSRLYQYIEAGRLEKFEAGNAFLLRTEELEQFQRNPPGRIRLEAPGWRTYKDAKVLTTEIDVKVREGQRNELTEKLQAMLANNQHTFPGTIARYIVQGNEQLGSIHILLVWKNTEMPHEAAYQRHMKAFQAELEDVLDWESAQIVTNQAIIYT